MRESQKPHTPRIDPGNKLGIDFHAPRASERFRPDRMEVHGKMPENLDTATFYDGDNPADMRRRIKDYLSVIKDLHSPEEIELLNNLKGQYDIAALVWTHLLPVNTSKMPNQAALISWLDSLSRDELAEISTYSAPQMQIIPKGKTLTYVRGMKSEEDMQEQELPREFEDVDIYEYHDILRTWKELDYLCAPAWKNVGADTWKFSITDAAEKMPMIPEIHYVDPQHARYDDPKRVSQSPTAILEGYLQMYRKLGTKAMPQYAYVPALLRTLLEGGNLFDTQSQNIFEKIVGFNGIPTAHSDGTNSLFLDKVHPDDDYGSYLRMRPYIESK